ncbi:MAG: hypothetical protein IH987_02720 [Planctomycetes bacterium]|nr:hypothetical protein [Planctomycetota bacterium]
MKHRTLAVACLWLCPGLLSGCVAGYNSLLFTTKTNVGLVVETKPPEFSLDIGRQELLLAPTYEEGKTPPVMASFRFENNNVFASYIGSTFTTGDAAVAMSRLYDAEDWPRTKGDGAWTLTAQDWKDEEADYDSSVSLSIEPKFPSFVPRDEPGRVRPVLFATDTSFDFKVSWSGMEAAYPDYIRLAYQRRELAFAAVTIGPELDANQNIIGLKARTPSLLATVDVATEVGKFPNTKVEYLQYFASGRAATALAMRKAVRQAMLRRLDPASAPELGTALTAQSPIASLVVVRQLYEILKEVSNDEGSSPVNRRKASRFVQKLEDLSTLVGPSVPVRLFGKSTETTGCYYFEKLDLPNPGFARVIDYWVTLARSLKDITSFIDEPTPAFYDNATGCDPAVDDNDKPPGGSSPEDVQSLLCEGVKGVDWKSCVRSHRAATVDELGEFVGKLEVARDFHDAMQFASELVFGGS